MATRTVIKVDPLLELSDLQIIEIAQRQNVDPANLVIERDRPLMDIDHKALYCQRFDSICKGAYFLLARIPDNYPSLTTEQRGALTSYIANLESGFLSALQEDEGSFSVCKKSLHNHSCLLVSAFALCLGLKENKTIQWLSKAEEYVLLTQPRDDLMTLSTVTNAKGTFYLLQEERQLSSLPKEFSTGCLSIALKTLPYPEWYQALEPIEQRFLRFVLTDVKTLKDVEDTLVNVSSRLRTLSIPANFRDHRITLFDENLTILTSSKRTASSMIASRDITDQTLSDFHASQNLQQVINQCIDEKVAAELSSRTFSEGEEVTLKIPALIQTLISPVIPSYFQPDSKLMKDKARAINDFVYLKNTVEKTVNEEGEEVSISLNIKVDLLSINHSLNYANRLDYTEPEDENCKKFIERIRLELKTSIGMEHKDEIEPLLSEYEKVLALGSFYQANYEDVDMRELSLSSLEQLIMCRIGIAYGSCVSAKDRKAIEFMNTDAMELYRSIYGKWLLYGEEHAEDRSNFVALFSHLYLSRHHQRSAAMNAPGSEGLKSPAIYAHKDTCDASDQAYALYAPNSSNALMKIEDQLASSNELRSIISGSSISWGRSRTIAKDELDQLLVTMPKSTKKVVGKTLSLAHEALIKDSLAVIKQITCEESKPLNKFWTKNTYYKVSLTTLPSILNMKVNHHPDGVKDLRVFLNHDMELNSALVRPLFGIISDKLKSPYARYPLTNEFYSIIESLFFNIENIDLMQNVNLRLRDFYQKATQRSWAASCANPLAAQASEDDSELAQLTL